MKLIVNPHKIEIDKSPVNEREIDITKCEFEFADEITNDYVKEAYFTFNGTSYKEIIVNNQCAIPNEVLAKKGQVEIGVVAFLVENEEEIKRYNPSPAYFNTWLGSLKDNAENSEPITPSEMEQFEQALNDGLNEVANVDIDAEQLDNGMSVTITNRYGEDKTVYAYDGEKGETGATPNIQIGTVVTGDHSSVTRTGTNENPIFNFVLEKGNKGDTGNGIANVTKTSTSGLVDTYTITYTNGTTTTFDVTNGKGITNIAKTSTSGLEDTYTITYNDNTTSTFTVTNGNGISSIEKTGTQDNVDTYTIYYTNGTTSTFTVTNSTVTNQEFEELKAEHEELVNTLPRVEGTGESITLDNTAQYKMNVALSGNTSQTQYTGKNLLEVTGSSGTTSDVVFTINNDGSVTAKGTASAEINKNLTTTPHLDLDPTKNYYLSGSPSSSSSTTYRLMGACILADNTTSYIADNTGNGVAVPATTKNIRVYINVKSGKAIDTTFYPMVEEGNSKTSYEPYVGGVPSPNPLYPQPIKKVTGNNIVYVLGKNWFNVDTVSEEKNINPNTGAEQSNESFNSSDYIPIISNTEYILSWESTSTYFQAGVSYYDKNKTFIEKVSLNTNGVLSKTFTTLQNAKYIRISYSVIVSGNPSPRTNIQLELGNTKTNYEPYQSQTYPINLPVENLFNKTTINENKRIDNNGVETNSNGYFASSFIKVQPNTQYIKNSPLEDAYHRFAFYSTNSQEGYLSVSSDNTITTPSNCQYLRFCGILTELDTTQLEKGTKVNSYTPYGTPAIEYCKIGNYSDEFYLDNGNWYLKKNIGKYTFTGSETGSLLSNNETTYLYNINGKTFNGVSNYSSNYYNNYSIANSTTSSTSNTNLGSYIYNHTFRMRVPSTIATTYELFQTWLANANNIIYYPLETPIGEAITDTTLIEQLNNLYNQIKSYKGQTNITQTNAELPFNIEASALYDLNNLISRVATLETEV